MVIFVDIKSNVDGVGDDPELLELDHDLLHAAGLKQPLPLALFPLASSQPLGQSHCVPIKPPFLCDPLTCSEADENPGDGEDDGPGEEEDAEQVGHPVAAVVVVD